MAAIRFHVQDDTGVPIAGARLRATSPNGDWQALTDVAGEFVAQLTPGHYDVTVFAVGFHARLVPCDLADPGTVTIGLAPIASSARLHIEGRTFKTENGAPWFYRGCSDFALFRRYLEGGVDAIAPVLLERLAVFGADVVLRVFRYAGNNNSFAIAPSTSPDRLSHAVELTRHLASRGLRIDWTAGDAQQVLPQERDQQAEVDAFYEAIEPEPNAFFQTCNEPFKNGIDVAKVKPRKGRALRSSGNYEYASWGDASFKGTVLDFLDYHGVRDGLDTDYPKAIWDPPQEMYSFCTVPIIEGEPFGFDEMLVPGRRSNRPWQAYKLAVERRLWVAGVTFHATDGIASRPFGPTTRACAEEFQRGLSDIG